MFSAERIRAILEHELPECTAEVVNPGDDGEHFSAEVVSSAFAGVPRVRQHQMVYAALGAHMHRDIHALALRTFTPEAWRQR